MKVQVNKFSQMELIPVTSLWIKKNKAKQNKTKQNTTSNQKSLLHILSSH